MEEFEIKKEITGENILENFNYYDFVAIIKLLYLDKVFDNTPLRKDKELKDKPIVKSQSGTEGKYDYSNFYSLEYLERDKQQACYWADLITSYLKLLEIEYSNKSKETREVQLQYWSEDYKQIWQLQYEEETKKWYLIKLKRIIPLPPQNWGD